jgi:hypothetical protein
VASVNRLHIASVHAGSSRIRARECASPCPVINRIRASWPRIRIASRGAPRYRSNDRPRCGFPKRQKQCASAGRLTIKSYWCVCTRNANNGGCQKPKVPRARDRSFIRCRLSAQREIIVSCWPPLTCEAPYLPRIAVPVMHRTFEVDTTSAGISSNVGELNLTLTNPDVQGRAHWLRSLI